MTSKVGKEYHRVRAILHERFPDTFPARKRPARALKLGIRHELLAIADLGIEPKALTRFLMQYAYRIEYQQALMVGAARVGLDGSAQGTVTPEQAKGAAMVIERRELQIKRRKSKSTRQ